MYGGVLWGVSGCGLCVRSLLCIWLCGGALTPVSWFPFLPLPVAYSLFPTPFPIVFPFTVFGVFCEFVSFVVQPDTRIYKLYRNSKHRVVSPLSWSCVIKYSHRLLWVMRFLIDMTKSSMSILSPLSFKHVSRVAICWGVYRVLLSLICGALIVVITLSFCNLSSVCRVVLVRCSFSLPSLPGCEKSLF